MKKLMRNPIAVLVCGMASLLLFGLIYVWSIFVAPLEAEFGWTRAETSVAYTLSMLCLFVGMALNRRARGPPVAKNRSDAGDHFGGIRLFGQLLYGLPFYSLPFLRGLCGHGHRYLL